MRGVYRAGVGAMSIHGPRGMGLYPPTLRAGVPFWGGAEGGGGLAVIVCTLPCGGGGGGVASGSSVRLGRKKPGGVPWGLGPPSRKNLGFAGGDSAIWYGMVWYGMVWYGMVWYGMVWYGMVWYGMVWYWYGMVWYGMVWYGMCMLLLLLLLGHPARAGGRNCQTRSPWAGRKVAVGRRHAGWACAVNDRGGGGGAPWSVGGGGARVEEGGATCGSYPGALPRLAGESYSSCAKRLWWGWRAGQ